jgi:hypothetical protein
MARWPIPTNYSYSQAIPTEPVSSWRSTLAGLDWTSSDLEKALEEIRHATLIGRLKMNPQFVAKTGFVGSLGSLTLLVTWLIFRQRSTPDSQIEGLESTEKVQLSVF